MMKTILSTLVLLILSLNSYAQKYHDALAFGLSGHVKECVINDNDNVLNQDPYGYDHQIEFDKDGRLIFYDYCEVSNVKRNSAGYLTSFECFGDYHIEYDINHRAIEVGREDVSPNYYLYDKNGRLIKTSFTDPEFKATSGLIARGTMTIKSTSYDSHNNFLTWQEVNFEGEINNNGKRFITYWDNPSTSKENYKQKDLSEIAFFNTVKVQKVFNVLSNTDINPVKTKERLVYTAPKGTTTKEVTAVYLVGYRETDDNPRNIPTRVNDFIYHDLGKDKEFLGLLVTSYFYQAGAEWKATYEVRIDDEAAQYLLDTKTDDTGWKFNPDYRFYITKDAKLIEYKKEKVGSSK